MSPAVTTKSNVSTVKSSSFGYAKDEPPTFLAPQTMNCNCTKCLCPVCPKKIVKFVEYAAPTGDSSMSQQDSSTCTCEKCECRICPYKKQNDGLCSFDPCPDSTIAKVTQSGTGDKNTDTRQRISSSSYSSRLSKEPQIGTRDTNTGHNSNLQKLLCNCLNCKCNPCVYEGQMEEKDNCTCNSCSCNPCVHKDQMEETDNCTCNTCICNPCAQEDPMEQKDNCTCHTCKCNPCVYKEQKEEKDNCTCNTCKCNPCVYKEQIEEKENCTCNCNPCVHKDQIDRKDDCTCTFCPDISKLKYEMFKNPLPCNCVQCICNPCADGDKRKKMEEVVARGTEDYISIEPKKEEVKVEKVECENQDCHCDPCPDPNKRKIQQNGAKCACPNDDCQCDPCSYPKKKTSEKGIQENIRLPCDCPICDCAVPCNEDAGKGEDNKCVCTKCTCDPCTDSSIQKLKSEIGKDVCDCPKCTCEDPKQQSVIPCNCPICSCSPCNDPNKNKRQDDPVNEVICHCRTCTCSSCPDQTVEQPVVTKLGTPPCRCALCVCIDPNEQPKENVPCDCPICKCSPCNDPNVNKEKENPTNQRCQCPKCSCSPCTDPSFQLTVATGQITAPCICGQCVCSDPKQQPKQHVPCDCPICNCTPCNDPNINKEKGDPTNQGCDCPTCSCSPCTDPKFQRTALCACAECVCINPIEHTKQAVPCDCLICNCSPCIDPNVNKGKGDPTNQAVPCDCLNCPCDPCRDPKCQGKKTEEKSEKKLCNCDVCSCDSCFDPKIQGRGDPTVPEQYMCDCPTCACEAAVDPIQKQKEDEAAEEGACECLNCTCNPCDMPNPKKNQQDQQECEDRIVAIEASAYCTSPEDGTLDCSLENCYCAECQCTDPEEAEQQNGVKLKDSRKSNCTCPKCVCTDCYEDNLEVRRECQCDPCQCTDCDMKKTVNKSSHDRDCICAECLCGEMQKSPTIEFSKCHCTLCSCNDCSSKKTGHGEEKFKTTKDNCICTNCTCSEDIHPKIKKSCICTKCDCPDEPKPTTMTNCLCTVCACSGDPNGDIKTNKNSNCPDEQSCKKTDYSCVCTDCTCELDQKPSGITCRCSTCSCTECQGKSRTSDHQKSTVCHCISSVCINCKYGKEKADIIEKETKSCRCNPCTCVNCLLKEKSTKPCQCKKNNKKYSPPSLEFKCTCLKLPVGEAHSKLEKGSSNGISKSATSKKGNCLAYTCRAFVNKPNLQKSLEIPVFLPASSKIKSNRPTREMESAYNYRLQELPSQQSKRENNKLRSVEVPNLDYNQLRCVTLPAQSERPLPFSLSEQTQERSMLDKMDQNRPEKPYVASDTGDTLKMEQYKYKKEMKVIKKALRKIKGSRQNDSKLLTKEEKPLFKETSNFVETMSELGVAFTYLKQNCKDNDKMIKAVTEELKHYTSNTSLVNIFSKPDTDQPKSDKTDDLQSLANYPYSCYNPLRVSVPTIHVLQPENISVRPYSAAPGQHRPGEICNCAVCTGPKCDVFCRSGDTSVNPLPNKLIGTLNYEYMSFVSSTDKSNRGSRNFSYDHESKIGDFGVSTCFEMYNTVPNRTISEIKNPPLIKQASYFGQTVSDLKMAVTTLQSKCKAKDKIIEEATKKLKEHISSTAILTILNSRIDEAPDYDHADDINVKKSLRDVEIQNVYKPPKVVPCKCGRFHENNKYVNLSGFRVINIKRITIDSIIVEWKAPRSKAVTGYDIEINGKSKSKILSGWRTCAMIHSVDISSPLNISIYAVTACGRCEPPSRAIYEIKYKHKNKQVRTMSPE